MTEWPRLVPGVRLEVRPSLESKKKKKCPPKGHSIYGECRCRAGVPMTSVIGNTPGSYVTTLRMRSHGGVRRRKHDVSQVVRTWLMSKNLDAVVLSRLMFGGRASQMRTEKTGRYVRRTRQTCSPREWRSNWTMTRDYFGSRAGQFPADGQYGAWCSGAGQTWKRLLAVAARRRNQRSVGGGGGGGHWRVVVLGVTPPLPLVPQSGRRGTALRGTRQCCRHAATEMSARSAVATPRRYHNAPPPPSVSTIVHVTRTRRREVTSVRSRRVSPKRSRIGYFYVRFEINNRTI